LLSSSPANQTTVTRAPSQDATSVSALTRKTRDAKAVQTQAQCFRCDATLAKLNAQRAAELKRGQRDFSLDGIG